MKECNHILGHYETESSGYDATYYETEFISNSESFISIETLKSCTKFTFCPHCGTNLEGFIERKIHMIQEEIDRKKEEKIKEEKRKKDLFQSKVVELGKRTKLDTLPDEGNFVVIFNPTKHSYGKNIVMAGTKQYLMECAVRHNEDKYQLEDLTINYIYKVLSPEDFGEILMKDGWAKKDNISNFNIFTKTDVNKNGKILNKRIDYSESGTIYLDTSSTDEDGETYTEYEQYSLHRLHEYLGFEIPLEIIKV